jgi:hypothetical protein
VVLHEDLEVLHQSPQVLVALDSSMNLQDIVLDLGAPVREMSFDESIFIHISDIKDEVFEEGHGLLVEIVLEVSDQF